MSWIPLLALVVAPIVLLGVGYLLVSILANGGADGAVLPSHYDPQRYARGGPATKPETARVGICEDCGVWTDPDEAFCLICTGTVREISRDRRNRTASTTRSAARRR